MSESTISAVLERQLLLQLGDRLRRLRKAQGLSAVQMAARCGMTRNTLRAVESGDPAPSMGTYLRVMSMLGISGELALLTGETLLPPPADSAAARSRRAAPVVQVHVSVDETRHRLQDLQSLGYRFIVVTNQSGVARGYFQAADVERIHRYMRSILQEEGIRDVRFLYCPHHPMGAVDRYRRTCSCRKPKPGMLLKGARRYGINLSASFMVGDRMKDKIAGMNSGCTGIRIGEYRWCRDLSVFSKYLTRKKKRTRRGIPLKILTRPIKLQAEYPCMILKKKKRNN